MRTFTAKLDERDLDLACTLVLHVPSYCVHLGEQVVLGGRESQGRA